MEFTIELAKAFALFSKMMSRMLGLVPRASHVASLAVLSGEPKFHAMKQESSVLMDFLW